MGVIAYEFMLGRVSNHNNIRDHTLEDQDRKLETKSLLNKYKSKGETYLKDGHSKGQISLIKYNQILIVVNSKETIE